MNIEDASCSQLSRQELATGLAGQNIDLVPVFDCLASGQPEVGDGAEYIQISDTIYFCF